jgi:hypothetical protein
LPIARWVGDIWESSVDLKLLECGGLNIMKIPSIRLACLGVASSCLLGACTAEPAMEKVEPQKVSMKNSPIVPGRPPEGGSITASADKFCLWNDKKYSDGASVCDSRIRYKCWGDKWVEVGQCKS